MNLHYLIAFFLSVYLGLPRLRAQFPFHSFIIAQARIDLQALLTHPHTPAATQSCPRTLKTGHQTSKRGHQIPKKTSFDPSYYRRLAPEPP